MAEYKALTFINLPLLDIKKAPGDTVTDEEFAAGGQTEEDINALVAGGSLSLDMDAELHPDNRPVDIPGPSSGADLHIVAGDEGKGVTPDDAE